MGVVGIIGVGGCGLEMGYGEVGGSWGEMYW